MRLVRGDVTETEEEDRDSGVVTCKEEEALPIRGDIRKRS